MDKLPITKNDYDEMLLMTNFLTEFKNKTNTMSTVQEVVFSPKKEGYCITFTCNNIPYAISLSVSSGIISTRLDVKYLVGTKKHQVLSSKNENENREIISKIFSGLL